MSEAPADLAHQLASLNFRLLVLSEMTTALGRAGDETVPGTWLIYLGGLIGASADTLCAICDAIPDGGIDAAC